MLAVLSWANLRAAFLDPGTATKAAQVGARYGFALVWALLLGAPGRIARTLGVVTRRRFDP